MTKIEELMWKGELDQVMELCQAGTKEELKESWLMELACKNNNVKVAKWLLDRPENTFQPTEEHVMYCLYWDRLGMATWLMTRDPTLKLTNERNLKKELVKKSMMGRLESVRWLIQHSPEPLTARMRTKIFTKGCIGGKLPFVQWAHDQLASPYLTPSKLFRSVCFHGHLDVAKWLLQVYPSISLLEGSSWEYTFGYILPRGGLKLVRWLIRLEPKLRAQLPKDLHPFHREYLDKN